MESRTLKNWMHVCGTTLTCFLYFSGYALGHNNHTAAIILLVIYVILGRASSELAYRVDRKLLEESRLKTDFKYRVDRRLLEEKVSK